MMEKVVLNEITWPADAAFSFQIGTHDFIIVDIADVEKVTKVRLKTWCCGRCEYQILVEDGIWVGNIRYFEQFKEIIRVLRNDGDLHYELELKVPVYTTLTL